MTPRHGHSPQSRRAKLSLEEQVKKEQSQTSQKKQMVFESIVDLIGGWYQGVYHRSMVERPKTWARVMREMEWHAAAAEQEDASQEST